MHAKVREGRVVKLEGNPESPINQGRLCSRGQAGLQGLYNPDRVTDPMARGPNGEWQKLSWEDVIGRLQAKVKEARGKGIARSLMARCAADCRGWGGEWLEWYVYRPNKMAFDFYRKLGGRESDGVAVMSIQADAL